ncbi:alpha/beta fold hydrolase [Catenuloplanes indicus]|uniref:Pimeloyl-ACP methyl ester carboxylesterase n=1 Tax=Catenuloplanes indicus TaxID=137267 RepID=A0AAE3VYN5_9ACTN|nr:alpha/beta fold hydrolase [Catenuloplanes indicus]MDQ0366658.1 pimeloyl-ACP methyl ester carboxylesterase [Catenuloplanes indicus]
MEEFRVLANGIEINVAIAGRGPAALLLHGFPHTWRVWRDVIPALARTHRVIAPDLRGLGGTTRADSGYDVATIAADAIALLDALGEPVADVAGIDLGTPPAFLLAMRHPARVRRLAVMESLAGPLPGAEAFLAGGPPWWFGFHGVPGLAERALAGNEAAYLDFFLRSGTHSGAGVAPEVRDAFISAYTGEESLRCAFAHYRALGVSGAQIADEAAARRLVVPALAIGARPVGDALHRQLAPIADTLTGHVIPDCGHIIPLDRPRELLALLEPFFSGA